ncbi:MAG: hypothetical protein U9R25_03585, partial [Chloroflexota bacterium]|nr:hypothetical protein [Chloroflexota bacterium]
PALPTPVIVGAPPLVGAVACPCPWSSLPTEGDHEGRPYADVPGFFKSASLEWVRRYEGVN